MNTRRRILVTALVIGLLIVPSFAFSANTGWTQGFSEWVQSVENRLAALEAAVNSTTTTTPETTTTTLPPTTTTTTTTTTLPPTTTTTTTTLPPTTTTTVPPTTTTTVPPTTTTTTPSGTVLTGNICATVHGGTAVLQGTVNLTCPLEVHGGVLVARAGVTVNGNGHHIDIMHGGSADFQGTPTTTWWNDGANYNLVRDINFNNVKRIMFHHGAGPSTIKWVRIDNSGGPELGDYPLHFHLNYETTRGTIVEGAVVSNSRQRAFVPHGSHGITFRDTIAYNIRGEAYWWDQPPFQSSDATNNSNDILYDRALAHTVRNHPDDNRGFRLAAFQLGAGLRNTVRDSVARNVQPSHPKDCSGFGWPEITHEFGDARVWTFERNASFNSSCHGIFIWQNNNSNNHVVDGFRGDPISQGAYTSEFRYRNVNVDNVVAHAVGWQVDGGSIGTVTAVRHRRAGGTITFNNVQVGRLVINNGSNSGNISADYRFNNTGLTCGDVVRQNVVSGTRVIINGTDC